MIAVSAALVAIFAASAAETAIMKPRAAGARRCERSGDRGVRATVWAMAYGTLIDLGALPAGITGADAYSVNESRQVVGTWSEPNGSFGPSSGAFVWDAAAGYRGVAGGNPFATAYAINNLGHAVGFSGNATSD